MPSIRSQIRGRFSSLQPCRLFLITSSAALVVALFALFIGSVTTRNASNKSQLGILLLVLRSNERQSPGDPTPYRASCMMIASRNTDDGWTLHPNVFRVRTESTLAVLPPEHESADFFRFSSHYTVGYSSIPSGLYSIALVEWKYPMSKAFQLSSWGSSEGTIYLYDPEIMTTYIPTNGRLHPNLSTIHTFLETTTSTTVTKWTKTEVYLHPSKTQQWDYRDSYGCLNIHDDDYERSNPLSEGLSDWDRMLAEYEGVLTLLPEGMKSSGLLLLPIGNETSVAEKIPTPDKDFHIRRLAEEARSVCDSIR
jgi:hypothetical protein